MVLSFTKLWFSDITSQKYQNNSYKFYDNKQLAHPLLLKKLTESLEFWILNQSLVRLCDCLIYADIKQNEERQLAVSSLSCHSYAFVL